MTRTLTAEQLRARAESLGLDFFIERRAGVWVKEWLNNGRTSATAEEVMMWSMLADREAQPAMWVMSDDLTDEKIISTPAYPNRVEAEERTIGELTPLYTAPPAPAVPGIDELRLTFERSERESDDGFNLHKYGIGYADEATQARWESWLSCRAAMLAQPVSGGYKLASGCQWSYDEMDFKWDSSCGESWQFIDGGPSENGVKFCQGCGKPVLLAAAPEGGNDHDTRR